MTGDARRVIEAAIAARVFPAATIEVGASDRVLWRDAVGTLTFDEDATNAAVDTIFDLASLTKPIATTTIIMQLVADRAVRLDERVQTAFEEWRGEDREHVTVRDLLEHASGLPARLVDPPGETRREFEHDICTIRLEYSPRTKSIYSDLGFILLGFLAADRGGTSLAEQFDTIRGRLLDPARARDEALQFSVSTQDRGRTAPTTPMDEDRRRGTPLIGEVHDNYAAALGGVAGHAGLFGTVGGVGVFGRAVLRSARGDASVPPPLSPALVAAFTAKSIVPGSSRGLGWDTMLPTSSCGARMSAFAFGHVGFTGTSLWIDPARDRYFVLLTNRVCGGGSVDDMRDLRRAFHDALGDT
jgi:CubicO group peptidase (beta-lactamase class C family)